MKLTSNWNIPNENGAENGADEFDWIIRRPNVKVI